MNEKPVKLVVPRWGRMFVNFMNKLYAITDDERIPQIIDDVADSKTGASTNYSAVFQSLNEMVAKGNACMTIAPDRKHSDSPYRIGFLGMDIKVDGAAVRIEGDELHNGTSLIKLAEADIALAGLDELLATNYTYLSEATEVTSWGAYNYNVQKPTDLRVAGSANLKTSQGLLDFVGLFLIAQEQKKYKTIDELATQGTPIFVKGRYEGAVAYAYGSMKRRKLNLVSVENVEEAVLAKPGSYGVEIVQSGNTLKQKGNIKKLVVIGEPLLNSESLFTVDKTKYCDNPNVQKVLDALGVMEYFNGERARDFADWFYSLEKNLGDNWIEKPDPIDMFFGKSHGLTQIGLWPVHTRKLVMDPDCDDMESAQAHYIQDTHSQFSRIIGQRLYDELKRPKESLK